MSIFLCPPDSYEENCAAGPVTDAQTDDIVAVLEQGNVSDLVESVYVETREEVYDNIVAADDSGVYSQAGAGGPGSRAAREAHGPGGVPGGGRCHGGARRG
ncbi:hypothetical protein [Demequina litorisediminis]|uniref:Uncharacterized protein n=1 Tax=Demequina litorisediminis TaxID=1849022 RepID=A0ABQ6IBX0_9MICO|nr:hypothetical protein GCM10025876_08860 [Demequina litorisediminis]